MPKCLNDLGLLHSQKAYNLDRSAGMQKKLVQKSLSVYCNDRDTPLDGRLYLKSELTALLCIRLKLT